MSELSKVRIVKVAPHASNVQFESDSGATYVPVIPIREVSLEGIVRERVPDESLRDDGEMSAGKPGIARGSLAMSHRVRGISGGGAGTSSGTGVSASRLTKTEIGVLLDMLTGAAGVDGTGADITGGSDSGGTLIVDETSGFPPGNAVLFDQGDGTYVAREVLSRSASSGSGTLTLDSPYSGTPTGQAYASATWVLKNATPNPVHLAVDVETDADRYKLYGCAGGGVVTLPANGGPCTLDVALDASHWAQVSPGLSFAAPTAGDVVEARRGSFRIGGATNEYDLVSGNLEIAVEKAPRAHYGAINGAAGFDIISRMLRLTGARMRLGSLAGEVSATSGLPVLRDINSATEWCLQVGRSPGSTLYVRWPQLEMVGLRRVSDAGRDLLAFDGEPRRQPSGAAYAGSARIHLF